MDEDFWDWYEKNKLDMFWEKYRLFMGIEGKSNWLKAKMHWAKVDRIRKECLESDDPHHVFEIAHFLDLPFFLDKWWDKLDRHYKERYLTETWFKKIDGHLNGLNWWIPYFNELGFITNCEAPKPSEPIVLYRGVEPYFRLGMSWTNNVDMAETFAGSDSLIGNKFVYGTVVQPESILAVFKGNAVDTDGQPYIEHGLEYVVNHQHLSFDDVYAIDDPEWDKVEKP